MSEAAEMGPKNRFFGTEHGNTPEPVMLEPTHAMMERFQAVLKQHLLRQKQKLTQYIAELEQDVKNINREEENIGEQLAVIKSNLEMQEKLIDEKRFNLRELAEKKIQLNGDLLEVKGRVKEKRKLNEEECLKEQEARIEMEKLHELENKVLQWKTEIEGDLAVNLRIAEKTEADRKRILEDNRKLDMHIFRLTTEVFKLDSELDLLNSQLEKREKEKQLLQEAVADSQADLYALAADEKRLLTGWNGLVVAMGQRDDAYDKVKKEMSAAEEEFRNLNTEIESYKKSGDDEIRKSQELELRLSRAKKETEKFSRALKILLEKKMNLERHVADTTELAMQAEKDLALSHTQTKNKELELQNVQKELEDLTRRKRQMEDDCLNLLLEQSANDKSSMNLNKAIQQLRGKAREQEMGFLQLENRISKLIMETEETKTETARNQEILDEMNRDADAREQELANVEMDTREIQNQIMNRQGKLVILTRKMEELALNAGWDELGKTPTELRIRDLQWELDDLRKANEQLESSWKRQQQMNVKLMGKRRDQVKEISLLRKQIILLGKKNMTTDQELEQEQLVEAEIQRNINNLQHRLTHLCKTLSEKSGHRDIVDKDLLLQQTAFIKSLKDAEQAEFNTKAEITEIEKQLEEKADVMLATQREMLLWEKRVKMALETKQEIQKEKSDQGDIGQMRQEIHRMEVRLGQLRKAQEKLINDLEQTIRRREAIVEEADAREKRERGTNRSRANFQRKLDEMRNRLKSLKQDEKMMDKLIAEAEENHEDLLNKMNDKNEQVRKLQSDLRQLDRKLEDSQLRYQMGVETLVRRQRKSKLYGQMKAGKYRPLYKNEVTMKNELGMARAVNSDLITILEALIADFPTVKTTFIRILNTLKPDDI